MFRTTDAFLLSWMLAGEINLISFSAARVLGVLAWVYGEIIAEDGLLKINEQD